MISRQSLFNLVLASSVLTILACGSNSPGYGGAGGASGSGGAAGSTGASCHDPATLNVTAPDMTAYVIDGASNPDLTLCRGSTYVFALNTPGHPFYIKSVQGSGTANAYDTGVTGNGSTSGTLTFIVPSNAPDTLYYNCAIHAVMTGTIHVMN
jgi:hypothetical protein